MYRLESGVKMSEENPTTFHIPSKEQKNMLKKQDIVKLVFIEDDTEHHSERMWVTITDRDGDNFVGELNNEPFELKSIKYGDRVEFHADNIINIYP